MKNRKIRLPLSERINKFFNSFSHPRLSRMFLSNSTLCPWSRSFVLIGWLAWRDGVHSVIHLSLFREKNKKNLHVRSFCRFSSAVPLHFIKNVHFFNFLISNWLLHFVNEWIMSECVQQANGALFLDMFDGLG